MKALLAVLLVPALAHARPMLDPAVTYSIRLDALDVYDGPADAKVTMVATYEYADPYSNKVRPALDAIKQKYGADLRIVWKPFVVHVKTATAQANAACAANKQHKWAALDAALWDNFKARKFDDASLAAAVDAAKLDRTTLNVDVKMCEPYTRSTMTDLQAFGVEGVPQFFINGRSLSGAQPQASFEKIIDEELAKANERIQKGAKAATYYQTFVVDKGVKAAPAVANPCGG